MYITHTWCAYTIPVRDSIVTLDSIVTRPCGPAKKRRKKAKIKLQRYDILKPFDLNEYFEQYKLLIVF